MTRFDSVGLWWQDYPVQRMAKASVSHYHRQVAVPVTGWTPHTEFPNLAGAKVLGLDTETKDPNLIEKGPGGVRKDGHVVGFSIATEDRGWYFPLRHEHEGEKPLNQDAEKAFAWLGEQLATGVPVVGANLLYDLEWLRAEGVPRPTGELFDVQLAEPLLDEQARSYALEVLAQQYLGQGKDTPLLYQWCADSFGGAVDGKQRANIYRAPPSLVGPYAESDALLPLRVLKEQRARLHEEGLTELFRMECALIPLLLDMRFRGVRVDVQRAQAAARWLREQATQFQEQIKEVDVWSAASIAHAFDRAGVEYTRTEAGNPSFTKQWLENCDHPLAEQVLGVRLYEKAANPFVESYILENHLDGRLHCQFNSLRSDDYGTVSGRFSSSNPNLQNIPSRHKVLGPLLRGLFIPEDGCKWRRADYSQVEYRALVHYAVGNGSEELRKRYNNDPTTDFHKLAIEMCREITGIMLDRTPAKNLNFGLVYGMGKEKLVRSLGVDAELGERLYNAYFEAMPSAKKTYNDAQRLAQRRGFIRTILKRRRRFKQDPETGERIAAHTALNALLQGSAADIIKAAMVKCYQSGVFAYTGIPHLTVHDELDWSDDQTSRAEEAFAEAKHIMETCVKMRVPLLVDMSTGANWGECK